ncbi:hypothetical protein [Actinomadura sp. WMMA1423]|uniref:hypothetical protein n=1 Tax=Actinomadura sp. WMMA1423 TaxID=2591108 RepID=UPI001146B1EF|nr:hypothetical protein [Actinomadura sp. WMMA1423]
MRHSHLLLDGERATAERLVGLTADITTRQGTTYTAELVRGYYAGQVVLRHADTWVQIDAADITTGRTHDDIPPAITRTVRVADRGTSRSYEGVTIRRVTLVWTCPYCGRPRGEPRTSRIPEDGEYYYADAWSNPCAHTDMYAQVLVEAGVHLVQRVEA